MNKNQINVMLQAFMVRLGRQIYKQKISTWFKGRNHSSVYEKEVENRNKRTLDQGGKEKAEK